MWPPRDTYAMVSVRRVRHSLTQKKCGNDLFLHMLWIPDVTECRVELEGAQSYVSSHSHRNRTSFQAQEYHRSSLWGCDATAACGWTGSELTRLFLAFPLRSSAKRKEPSPSSFPIFSLWLPLFFPLKLRSLLPAILQLSLQCVGSPCIAGQSLSVD